MKNTALIGHTGFVGGNLAAQTHFDALYNSINIGKIIHRSFDLVVCAGASAEKWKANLEPENDLANIQLLMDCLGRVSCLDFVLISTVDIYPLPHAVYEDSPIETKNLGPYGLHRYMLEEFVREKFPQAAIIRLPGLFGTGLKKNFIFDMLKKPEALHLTHSESKFQFYGLDMLWPDIQVVIQNRINLVNFATPPVSTSEIAFRCFKRQFANKTSNEPVSYDMRTRHASIFGHSGGYMRTKEEELDEIDAFVARERGVR